MLAANRVVVSVWVASAEVLVAIQIIDVVVSSSPKTETVTTIVVKDTARNKIARLLIASFSSTTKTKVVVTIIVATRTKNAPAAIVS